MKFGCFAWVHGHPLRLYLGWVLANYRWFVLIARVLVMNMCSCAILFIWQTEAHQLIHSRLVGWLFWLTGPFQTVFQSISGRLPKRGRKRREKIEESKNVQTTPPTPTANTIGPCPTIIQTVGRPGTGSIPRTIAPPDHPRYTVELQWLEHWWFVYHGYFELVPESHSCRHYLIGIFWLIFFLIWIMVCCVYSLETPRWGDSN